MRRKNWRSYINAADEKPRLSWELVKRVLAYGKPYTWKIIASLVAILVYTGVALLSPLILRHLIDYAIPEKDIDRLIVAAAGLLILPIISGFFQIITRRLTSQIGEGVIYDLRVSLYKHLQRMSLRFFTHTQLGELISRLNNDVVGAQTAISRTLVTLVTNFYRSSIYIDSDVNPGMAVDLDGHLYPAVVYHRCPTARTCLSGNRQAPDGNERPDERNHE
jgi:ATP-binding cassette subfamily B protein